MSLFVIPLLLICIALITQQMDAVSPAPDGSYAGANTAEGNAALFSLTTGGNNTAIGSEALFSVTTGNQNTATGAQALKNNTADQNTADGFQALVNNTSGSGNTATGWRALFHNTGFQNTADGASALSSNTTGFHNTATGSFALQSNTTGQANTASGYQALHGNTDGLANTGNGFNALVRNTTGSNNTADGFGALQSNTTGSSNTALGVSAGSSVTTASNVIAIGHPGTNVDNSCFIGNIYNVDNSLGGGIKNVTINQNGQLGTSMGISSRRFKSEIKPMATASESILALKPVTFHYKSDAKGVPQFGLIAEEVAEVNPDLVERDKKGEIYTVRYDAVNAMLLNEFLKEHREVHELKKQVAALTAGLQKVSAQLDPSRRSSQVADNN